MIRIAEYFLYGVILVAIFTVMGNYKFQPELSAKEYVSIEQSVAKIDSQKDFLASSQQGESEISQDLSELTINRAGFSPVVGIVQDLLQVEADGYYGEQTVNAIMQFQEENDLATDGILGTEVLSKVLEDHLPLTENDIANYPFIQAQLEEYLGIEESENTMEVLQDRLNEQTNTDLQDGEILNEKVFMLIVQD